MIILCYFPIYKVIARNNTAHKSKNNKTRDGMKKKTEQN